MGVIGFMGFMGFIGFIGFIGRIGFIGFIGFQTPRIVAGLDQQIGLPWVSRTLPSENGPTHAPVDALHT
jgi:hypothetical protein